ncbi:MAG: DMT family protein [Pirellulales bacterium]|nr:DMT family protein [Pirellulales bacterium]
MRTAMLLICSNAFMTAAWYGHLRYKSTPLLVAILVSWLTALPEYMLQVPANRLGHSDTIEQAAGGSMPSAGPARTFRYDWRICGIPNFPRSQLQ